MQLTGCYKLRTVCGQLLPLSSELLFGELLPSTPPQCAYKRTVFKETSSANVWLFTYPSNPYKSVNESRCTSHFAVDPRFRGHPKSQTKEVLKAGWSVFGGSFSSGEKIVNARFPEKIDLKTGVVTHQSDFSL